MKSIAIVGLGWFGFPLAEKLKSKGFEIFGTSTRDEKTSLLKEKGYNCITLNLNQEVKENVSVDFLEKCDYCLINIPPSKTLFNSYQNQILKLVSLFDKNCKFIFISSTGVYTDTIQNAVEDSKILTDFNYSSQLFLTEKALKKELNERLIVLRFAGLVGPNRNPAKFLAGKQNLTNGDSPVNLVHLDDCISFVERILETNFWGETFNVCSSIHPLRKDYYTENCRKNLMEIPSFSSDTKATISKTVSNEKGKNCLNFSYKFDSPFEF